MGSSILISALMKTQENFTNCWNNLNRRSAIIMIKLQNLILFNDYSVKLDNRDNIV